MQITKNKLKKIINEELQKLLNEEDYQRHGPNAWPWETEFEKGAPAPQLPPAGEMDRDIIPGVRIPDRRPWPDWVPARGDTFRDPRTDIDPETGERVMLDPSIAPWEHDMQNELR